MFKSMSIIEKDSLRLSLTYLVSPLQSKICTFQFSVRPRVVDGASYSMILEEIKSSIQ